jgi:hypothetical protein
MNDASPAGQFPALDAAERDLGCAAPSFTRLFAVFGGGLVALFILVIAARALAPSDGLPGIVVSVISGMAATLIFGSLGEWVGLIGTTTSTTSIRERM